MPIKNYTSSVPVSRSVQYIVDKLVRHGARNIMQLYNEKKQLTGICFITDQNGKNMPFKLPARVDNCEKVLRAQVRRPTEEKYKKIREQAERTAWKLVSDWVDIQMSLIALDQVEFLEVFLPYVYFPAQEKTYFEQLKGSGFLAITEDAGVRS